MIIIDIEATGTEPQKHSILSIGALDSDDPENRFYGECRTWEGAHVMDEALKVNGFSEEAINDPNKKIEAELLKQFLEWSKDIKDRTLAGQNPSFDRDFLKAAAERAGVNWDFSQRTIDSHTLCYMHMIKREVEPPFDNKHNHSALNLDTILDYCGIPEEPKPHNALNGALSHAEVIHRLLHNKPLLKEFEQYPLAWG